MLVGYFFEARPDTCAHGTVGSCIRCSHSKNRFDESKQDCLVQIFGCGNRLRFDAIQAKTHFLLLDQEEDKKRLFHVRMVLACCVLNHSLLSNENNLKKLSKVIQS